MASKKKKDNIAGMVFVGVLFLGVAGGMIYGNVAIGSVLGLGLGFLAQAYFKMKK